MKIEGVIKIVHGNVLLVRAVFCTVSKKKGPLCNYLSTVLKSVIEDVQ